jgi:hypothetical protein
VETILREEALALEAEGPAKRQALEASLQGLDEFLRAAHERLALLPADLLPGYMEMLRGKKQERDQVQDDLRALYRQRPQVLAAERVAEARARMERLRDLMLSSDPAEVKNFLRSLVQKVELSFVPSVNERGRRRYHFRQGILTVFCQDGSLTELAITPGGPSG